MANVIVDLPDWLYRAAPAKRVRDRPRRVTASLDTTAAVSAAREEFGA